MRVEVVVVGGAATSSLVAPLVLVAMATPALFVVDVIVAERRERERKAARTRERVACLACGKQVRFVRHHVTSGGVSPERCCRFANSHFYQMDMQRAVAVHAMAIFF